MQRTHLLFPLAVLAAFAPLAALPRAHAAPPKSDRERIPFDADWHFKQSAGSTAQSGLPLTDWLWHTTSADADPAPLFATTFDSAAPGWTASHPGDDVFHGRQGYVWFRTTLPNLPQANRILSFESVDDNATVYLNGVKLLHHEGWDEPFTVALDAAWKPGGPNVLVVLVENTAGAGGISGSASIGNPAVGGVVGEYSAATVDDSHWRTVHLPHDYVIEGTFDSKLDAGHAALPVPSAWYRKTFTLPASDKGKAVWIDFDGVYRDSTVWLNGQELGHEPSGYTGFRYDISKAANFGGVNHLAVYVNPRKAEGWWYEGGGIYRHVWLNVANPIHVASNGVAITTDYPVKSNVPSLPGDAAQVNISTTLVMPQFPSNISIASHIRDPRGHEVATITNRGDVAGVMNGSNTIVQHAILPDPALWSIESPKLYTVETEVAVDGKVIDTTTTTLGIRTIRFDADKGFFLNGKSVKIQGTCNHQDFIGVGTAMPDSVLYWRVARLKEMGCNAIRMSHNPPAAEFLDACDKLGVMVMDENRHLGDTESPKTSHGTKATDLSELKEMLLRDRNHPSIIMWSMCNEEPLQGSVEGGAIFKAMMDVVHQYDTTRPITCAMNGGWGSGITLVQDLQGCNYNPNGYDNFHAKFPKLPMYGSETASTVSARGDYEWEHFDRYYGNEQKAFVNAYDVNAPPWAQTAEDAWRPIAERPFIAGGYIWTGFDYKGEPTPFGWPDINSNFGVIDMCGFPKDLYYYYQSVWIDKPIVHILPHWTMPGMEGKPIRVWAFSNAERIELFLNGQSLGAKPVPKYGHVEWSVPYASGKLEAKAYAGDKLIATDAVETAGAPVGFRLTTDRKTVLADGEDVTMVGVEIVDAKGRVVPDAANMVTFTIDGAATVAGVGNGDPTCHEPDKASQRSAFHGKCMVLVGEASTTGSATLTVSAPGLKSATLGVKVEKP